MVRDRQAGWSRLLVFLALAWLAGAAAVRAAPALPGAVPEPPALTWTDWADLALASPAVIRARVERTGRLGRRAAPDVPAGEIRVLVVAELVAALKAPAVLPARAEWLWQGAPGPRGRPPFARGQELLLFAAPVGGSTDPDMQQFRLAGPRGQQSWSPQADAIVRAVLQEAATSGAPMVTGVSDAFRTEGAIPGTSESQFFLATESGSPIALLVRREAGAAPRVLAATGDMIDRAAPVRPRTLLWRALACGLPPALPARIAGDPGLAADHALARTALGPCGRRLDQVERKTPTARASG